MATLKPYINFADKTKDAFEFYTSIFDGTYELTLVKDSANGSSMPADWAERVFHGEFTSDTVNMLGSDIISDQAGRVVGNVHSLALMCDSAEQLHSWFDKLAEGGKVVWPATDSEWGAIFGQVVDKYGIQWMLNYDKKA